MNSPTTGLWSLWTYSSILLYDTCSACSVKFSYTLAFTLYKILSVQDGRRLKWEGNNRFLNLSSVVFHNSYLLWLQHIDWQDKQHEQGQMKHYKFFCLEKPLVNNHLGNLGIYRRMVLKWTLKKWGVKINIELQWFMTGCKGGGLWTWCKTCQVNNYHLHREDMNNYERQEEKHVWKTYSMSIFNW